MTLDPNDLRDAIRAQAKALGFAACGFARADAAPEAAERLDRWLESGAHGSMGWMEARRDQRARPQALWPDARSLIMLGMSYAPKEDPLRLAAAPGVGRISVYAQGSDYHDIVKKALKALARWLVDRAGGELKVFVDTAPVMEKPLAAAAGIGWQGKHSNLVSRDHGSWLFLGAIMTSLDLPPDPPHGDRCGSCDACQRACPTDAFPRPYVLDARRCVSYLTIEHKGPIPHDLRAGIGNRIYGCDDCLAVCPWNKFAEAGAANRAFAARAELAVPALEDLLGLDDASFRAVFAGSPIKRIGRDRMMRNALVAAGNDGGAGLAVPVAVLLDDPAPEVRGAAIWALARIDPTRLSAEAGARRDYENDQQVLNEWDVAIAKASERG
ncbi:MAG: tRNA epoxyqueuosine(34) reductase QueG [Rhizorhabdus sp.]|jgi:epoxyqueuosine reductase|uniref:tRNA epoxyqueuosine(34) reductase QueG n=3 Tax=Rhizorhabdus sp. TaxID=1968843 RepID=UPI001B4232EE|nr:tRNA epoxyqueuosine(34) reductase QueG [Rhizorhabdus sp.]MBP8230764.1 tRNA epoxyqueuosine(34) reductase QueG [Rhizorhabdus sp.]